MSEIQRFSLLSPVLFCQSDLMRLVVVIVILGVVIWLGWSKPFKERYAEAKRTITSELNDLGKKPQKNQDSSVKRR